ncbi:hypothetical protein EDD75_2235 [Thermodesulfitimonas autotrophica]|uniref:Uncharacterized protein n=1 Tax=Thermodesulfitimonas autotrophica TaxID=1894989 RepID=A0A3N5ABP8_9THEO|nr:hypothetical protein [Thermodesulfitimonas autotrophica]RPF42014.1 hypothetical protein EDD75_2235 [Thermodesulfitimonas autotrophica]
MSVATFFGIPLLPQALEGARREALKLTAPGELGVGLKVRVDPAREAVGIGKAYPFPSVITAEVEALYERFVLFRSVRGGYRFTVPWHDLRAGIVRLFKE